MKLNLNKNSPLGLREQLKIQIRTRIKMGDLAPGQALPTAREMASLLNVNKNTVSQVYKELENAGLLTLTPGSGTFVNQGCKMDHTHELIRIFEEALAKAGEMGFDREQALEFFISSLLTPAGSKEKKRILVVDCNQEAIDDITNSLISFLDLETHGVFIQELENAGNKAGAYLEGIDLVVCGLNHMEEFNRVFPESPVELAGVLLRPDIRIINELVRLPAGTRVGLVCANQRSAETLYKTHPFDRGAQLVKIMAGLNESEAMKKVINDCQVIYATNYIYEKVCALAGPEKRVIKVDLTIDQANIELVRDMLYGLN